MSERAGVEKTLPPWKSSSLRLGQRRGWHRVCVGLSVPPQGVCVGGVPVWLRGFLETSKGKGIRPAGGPDAHTPAGSYHPLSAGGEAFSFKYSPGKLRGNQYKKMMTKEELEEEQR